jgi:outer membrane lipoprotein SlyB
MSVPHTNPSSATAAAGPNTPSLVVGGLGLMAMGALAAVLFLGKGSPTAEAPPASPATVTTAAAPPDPVASAAALAADPAPVAKPLSPEPAAAPVGKPPAPKRVAAPVAALPAATAPAQSSEPAPSVRAEAPPAPPAPVQAAKPVCTTCGVVLAVTPVQRKGEAGALGTVGGAVLGGVLGHQTGGGSGKTAMTVLGAVGGAMAGREIEKHQRSTTFYDVRVRMDDGSTSTFTVESAFDVGQKVRVDGGQLLPRSTPQSSGN